jgi:histidyl-tRNA synthetase
MRDILPTEKSRRERVLATVRAVYRAHGFDEIETPVVEDAARLFSGLGGDNEKLAYAVMKRGLTMDDLARAETPLDLADLGLRFDLTVPLARFYASNRAQLPSVFRAIQIAPVWRAERPQKGRYRQFVQCDIDIIGEPGVIAEVELITATAAALDALGVPGCSIRINDRRILTSMLSALGFAAETHAAVLISLDKLDKIAPVGVVAELTERGMPAAAIAALQAVPAFAAFGSDAATPGAPATAPALTADAIAAVLPAGVDEQALTDLAAIAAAVAASSAAPLVFDPFLVRGMGYYTGPIFEVAHPELGYSLGGGGRYDGMIGRFLGTDVAATGFSLGFERLIDLVEVDAGHEAADAALLYDADVDLGALMALKAQLVTGGARVRLLKRPKNMKAALDQLAAEGFARFAVVAASPPADADALDWRRLEPAS